MMCLESQEQLQQILDYYKGQPREQEQFITMLREIMEIDGRLTTTLLEYAAKELEIKPSLLTCLVKFSPDLKRSFYEHYIIACTGERCARKDSMELLGLLKKELKPDKNGISSDKKILLSTRNCLKHCKTAPNLLVDGELFPHMTKEQLPEMLRKLRSS